MGGRRGVSLRKVYPHSAAYCKGNRKTQHRWGLVSAFAVCTPGAYIAQPMATDASLG